MLPRVNLRPDIDDAINVRFTDCSGKGNVERIQFPSEHSSSSATLPGKASAPHGPPVPQLMARSLDRIGVCIEFVFSRACGENRRGLEDQVERLRIDGVAVLGADGHFHMRGILEGEPAPVGGRALILPQRGTPRRFDADARAGILALDFVLEPLLEARAQLGRTLRSEQRGDRRSPR